ncbi:MAG: pilin [Candidatus Saccharibacteria bacterium]|nr:pilin [Candidatus Saccharibacteria bacterium]
MKKLKAILVSLPVTSLVFGGVLLATVATTVLQSQSVFAQGTTVKDGISGGASTAKGDNQPDNLEGQQGIFKKVTDVLLFLAGAVAVIVLIIGGIRYVISSGDSGQVQSAKNTILYAVVGLVVVIMAYAIVNFVVNQFQGNGGSAA